MLHSEKKTFTLKGTKQTFIDEDYSQKYFYIDDEYCDDLCSHFFNMEFECENKEIIFLVCHAYTRWQENCQQSVEYEFYLSNSLNSLEYNKLDYSLINSNNDFELEEIIESKIIFEGIDEGQDIDEFIGETFYI